MSWQDQAACRGADPQLFFPERSWDSKDQVAEAKQICASCPVREDCLDRALADNEQWGVWGGLTQSERRRLRRRPRERRCEICGASFTPTIGTQITCRADQCVRALHRRNQSQSRRRTA